MLFPLELFELSAMSAIVPAFIGILCFRKLTMALRIILLLLVVSLVCDYIALRYAEQYGQNSFIINLYILAQTFLVGSYFCYVPVSDKKYLFTHKIILFLTLAGVTLLLVFSDMSNAFNRHAFTLSSFGVLVHCGVFLTDIVRNWLDYPLSKNVNFYVVASLFIYHSSIFVVYLTFGYLNENISEDIWEIKLTSYVFFNFFVSYAYFVRCKFKESNG